MRENIIFSLHNIKFINIKNVNKFWKNIFSFKIFLRKTIYYLYVKKIDKLYPSCYIGFN